MINKKTVERQIIDKGIINLIGNNKTIITEISIIDMFKRIWLLIRAIY
jgi:hypothetical protein